MGSIVNFWVQILEWFQDRKSRTKLIMGFNQAARESFVHGVAPVILEAGVSSGYRPFRHQFSNVIMGSGFRIKVRSGMQLSKKDIINIGNTVLSSETLERRLVVLGFDTLEVHCDVGDYGCRWQLHDCFLIND